IDRPEAAASDSLSPGHGDRGRGRVPGADVRRIAPVDARSGRDFSSRLDARQRRGVARAWLSRHAARRRAPPYARGAPVTHSEEARQWVHIGSASFALLLRFLTWWQAAALAGTALIFNTLVLPRIGGRRLFRPIDEARGFPLGILLYPLAVLLLILVFPTRLDIVAAAWGILALGDGAATLVGRAASRNADTGKAAQTAETAKTPNGSALPWNRDKTFAGTIG